MTISQWIRQTHRWISIAFTLGTIVNIVAIALDHRAFWIGLLALAPLLLLLASGLYLFAQPWLARRRDAATPQRWGITHSPGR